MDDNGSKLKKRMRKPLSKTTSAAQFQACNEAGVNGAAQFQACNEDGVNGAAQFQACNEAGVNGAVKVPKSSKKRQKKNGNSEKNGDSSRSSPSEKKGDNSRSPSSGFPEHSSLTKIEEEYRALRRDYLILEEECAALTDEVERDIEILEAEKHALLDKLVVLEGLVDDSDLECWWC